MTSSYSHNPSEVGQDWDTYWQGTTQSAAYQDGGPQEPLLEAFWLATFQHLIGAHQHKAMLDLACGSGAVTGYAAKALAATGVSHIKHYCVDYSHSAVQEVQKRYPWVKGVSADAKSLPFFTGQFSAVVSQFGIEYAGVEAFAQGADMIAPKGTFVAVCHLHEGAIFSECKENRDVTRGIIDSNILPVAKQAFSAGYAFLAGKGNRQSYLDADKKLAPIVRHLRALLEEKGKQAGGGLLFGMYKDLGYMYEKIEAFNPQDVYDWLDRMQHELLAYHGRMSSMLDAALTASDIADITQMFQQKQFNSVKQERMCFKPGAPAAWCLMFSNHQE